jgi:hypothetical protein
MWFIRFLQSGVGRSLKVVIALWCFSVGSQNYSLNGLLLMMVAVVLGATAIARVCLIEEAVQAWELWHRGPVPRHP